MLGPSTPEAALRRDAMCNAGCRATIQRGELGQGGSYHTVSDERKAMHVERIVGLMALLIGLVLLLLCLARPERGAAGLEDLALVASGLVMSVFGVAIAAPGAGRGGVRKGLIPSADAALNL
jgi:hypothetical protein